MIKDYIHLSDLLHKQQSGFELSPEEEQELTDWQDSSDTNSQLYERIRTRKFSREAYEEYFQTGNARESWEKIRTVSGYEARTPYLSRRIFRLAASVILILGIGSLYFFLPQPDPVALPLAENIKEERPQVILTLSDGRTIPLSSQPDDTIIVEKESVVIKNRKGNLQYAAVTDVKQLVWNKIEVPRGGKYQLTLSDGSRIWLNSDSRLEYPVTFAGNCREIRLEGEAYFEVRPDTISPFIVHTSEFDVRVLGTEFNVRTYAESDKSATLVKGKVQLEHAGEIQLLSPGQQGRLIDHKLDICEVDTARVTSWLNDILDFKESPLEIILSDLARWHDLDIFYQNPEVKDYHFTAWFYRSDSIQQVVDLLEKTNKIRIKMNGRTLVVGKR